MTNEEKVNRKFFANPRYGKSPLHFREPRMDEFFTKRDHIDRLNYYNEHINNIKTARTIENRLLSILSFSRATYDSKNRKQCHSDARRSAGDLWRIYNYYFPDEKVDLFTIMRTLYKLVETKKNLNTYRCSTVRKQVFWFSDWSTIKIDDEPNEFGVQFRYWERIGL